MVLQDSPEALDKVIVNTWWFGSVLTFVLLVAWPLLALPAKVFSEGYFTFHVSTVCMRAVSMRTSRRGAHKAHHRQHSTAQWGVIAMRCMGVHDALARASSRASAHTLHAPDALHQGPCVPLHAGVCEPAGIRGLGAVGV